MSLFCPCLLFCFSALAPGCKSYFAVLKRKEADGTYSSVDEKEQLLSGQKHEFKLFAVPPKAGSNLRPLVSVDIRFSPSHSVSCDGWFCSLGFRTLLSLLISLNPYWPLL